MSTVVCQERSKPGCEGLLDRQKGVGGEDSHCSRMLPKGRAEGGIPGPSPWWEMKKSEEKAGKGWEMMQRGDGAGGEITSSCPEGLYGLYVTCWLCDSETEPWRAWRSPGCGSLLEQSPQNPKEGAGISPGISQATECGESLAKITDSGWFASPSGWKPAGVVSPLQHPSAARSPPRGEMAVGAGIRFDPLLKGLAVIRTG